MKNETLGVARIGANVPNKIDNFGDIKAPIGSSGLIGDKRRTTIDDIPIMKTPLDTCQCKTCRYRYPDPYGYRNGNCHKYKKESGKPNDILFKGAKCTYYRIDRSDKNKKEESK